MNWLFLVLAGIAEITWAVALKYSNGFQNLWPSIITVVAYIASLVLLAFALKRMNLGVAYAIWTGIGIVGTTVLGIFLFKEQLSVWQVICIALIFIGVIGLKLLEK